MGESPQPDESEPVPTAGSHNDREEAEADIGGKEPTQRNPNPRPLDIVRGGPSQEGGGIDGEKNEGVYQPRSASSIPPSQGPDGTWTHMVNPAAAPDHPFRHCGHI